MTVCRVTGVLLWSVKLFLASHTSLLPLSLMLNWVNAKLTSPWPDDPAWPLQVKVVGGYHGRFQVLSCSRGWLPVSLAGTAISIIFVSKFCRDKTHLLSRQKFYLDKIMFVATKICWSRQTFYRDKHTFAVTFFFYIFFYILVAAPANDSLRPSRTVPLCSVSVVYRSVFDWWWWWWVDA